MGVTTDNFISDLEIVISEHTCQLWQDKQWRSVRDDTGLVHAFPASTRWADIVTSMVSYFAESADC